MTHYPVQGRSFVQDCMLPIHVTKDITMTYVIEAIAIGYTLNILYQFTMGLVRLFNHPCTDTQKEQEDVLPSDLDRLDVEETTGLPEPIEIDYEYGGCCNLDLEVLLDAWGLGHDVLILSDVRYDLPMSGKVTVLDEPLRKERRQWMTNVK